MSTEVTQIKMSANVIETVTCQFHTVAEKYYTLEETISKKEEKEEKEEKEKEEKTQEESTTKKDGNVGHLFIKVPQ